MEATNFRYSDGSIKYKMLCTVCKQDYCYGKKTRKQKLCEKCLLDFKVKVVLDNKPSTKHNLTKNKNYSRWQNIKKRCTCVTYSRYKDWGGRGILLADYWINDPKSFINYIESLENANKAGYTLDRINNNGNYEIGNLRWATAKTQANNQRNKKTNTGKDYITQEKIKNYIRYRVCGSNQSFINIDEAMLKRKEIYGF